MSLRAIDLVATSGGWHGLLFDNPATGYSLELTWAFHVDFLEIESEAGRTRPALDIDWVPLGVSGWPSMAGAAARGRRFADPIETSLYVFSHHRFDAVELGVQDQDQLRIRLTASVSADLDGVGIDRLDVDEWLTFGGIYVQASAFPADVDAAAALLAQFTDVTDLVGETREHNYLFRPAVAPM